MNEDTNNTKTGETTANANRGARRRGMGRIFQRGSVWWISYSYRGKEYREPARDEKNRSTEAIANKRLKQRLGEIGNNKLTRNEERVTFEELVDDLRTDYRVNNRKAVKAIEYPLKHLTESFALYRALDITTDKVKKHIERRQTAGAKNATINRELSALKRMFSLAVQGEKLSSKPYIPTLREDNARTGFLDYGSFLVLREALPTYLRDPIGFLYFSGWRVSEMRQLEWRDVDLQGKVVRLRPELSKNKDGRLLPLEGELLGIIERAKANRRLDLPYVFHCDGRPIGDFRESWKTACVAVGLGRMEELPNKKKRYVGLIPHDFRRSAVRNMIRAGVPERVAMSLSGHKTRSVFDRYNVVSEGDLANAAEKLQAHLEAQRTPVIVPVIIAPRKRSRDEHR